MTWILAALIAFAPVQEKKRDGMSGQEWPLTEAVKLHYVSLTADPPALKAVLEKIKGVEGVTFTPNENSITVMYTGKVKDLRAVEAAAASSGVPAYTLSHALVGLKVTKADKSADVNGLYGEIDKVDGVKTSAIREGGIVEIVCNLEACTITALKEAAEKAKFKAECITHESVDIYTQGDKYTDLVKQLNGVKGLVVVKIDNQTGIAKCIGMKKAATDDAIKKAVEKAGMKLNEVKR